MLSVICGCKGTTFSSISLIFTAEKNVFVSFSSLTTSCVFFRFTKRIKKARPIIVMGRVMF